MTQENAKKMSELKAGANLETFSTGVVSLECLEQMILAHQLKYVEEFMQAQEEQKLVDDNIRDLDAFPEEVVLRALEISDKAQYDPDYFTRNNVDKDLHKPIAIINNIKAKKNEAKIKTWKVQYHERIIANLRHYKHLVSSCLEKKKPQSWLKAFFS